MSVFSSILPVQSPQEMLLAVGKGSGSLEVWKCDIFSKKFDKAGSYDVHDQVVSVLLCILSSAKFQCWLMYMRIC